MKIISSSSKFVSFAVVVVLVGVSTHTFAASGEQSAATSDSKSVKSASAAPILTYRPPLRGAPTTRVGGGTRSSSYALLTLTALAPNHTSLRPATTERRLGLRVSPSRPVPAVCLPRCGWSTIELQRCWCLSSTGSFRIHRHPKRKRFSELSYRS